MARMRNQGVRRTVLALALALPLLAPGPCLIIAQQSLVNGFFDAVTPLLVENFARELGVPGVLTPIGDTSNTGGDTTTGSETTAGGAGNSTSTNGTTFANS